MRKIAVILIMLIVIFSGFHTVTAEDGDEADWTFIFYMGGDGEPSEISEQVDKDIDELSNVPLDEDINLIILSDENESGDSRLIEIENGQVHEMSLMNIDPSWDRELDMSHRSTLRSYIQWAVNQYPAEHHMLTLWGHGKSWKGLSVEDHELLTLDEIDYALNGYDFDIVGFDACTMASFETYYQLKEHADIVISSEMEETIEGWPYDRIVQRVDEEEDLDPKVLSDLIIEEYVEWSKIYSGVPSGLTAVRTDELPLQELNTYAHTLERSLPYYFDEVEGARLHSQSYNPYPNPRDLYHFIELVNEKIEETRLNRAGTALQEGIEKSILRHELIPVEGEKDISNSSGYGISFPRSGPLSYYESLDFTDTDWDEWLTFYSNQTGLRSPPSLELTVNNFEEYAEISIDHEEREAELVILHQGVEIYSETIEDGYEEVNISLDLGDYVVEAYIYQGDQLYNHEYEFFELNKTFRIEGRLSSRDVTDLNVFNPRNNKSKNFSVARGEYDIGLDMPGFCEEGDELLLTYSQGGQEEQKTIVVEGESVEQDIRMGFILTLELWIMISHLLLFLMILLVYLKRKIPRPENSR